MFRLMLIALLFITTSFLQAFTTQNAVPSISFTASNQLRYWSENVKGPIPQATLFKLSPLNQDDTELFTSLLSKKSLGSNPKFCILANLACNSDFDSIRPLGLDYVSHKSSLVVQKVDPSSYFRMSVLHQGNRIHFSDLEDQFPQRAFLPSQIASKVSLDENEVREIFPQSFVNPYTKGNIETTLLHCNATALKGEIKNCSKSIEEMIKFSKNVLGTEKLVALTSKSTNGSGKEVIIGNIKKVNAKRVVACHDVFLPFATYFCHMISSTQAFAVEVLEPQTKVSINTVFALCHMDTASWPANHPAFEILETTPGQGEACHWIAKMDLLWVGARDRLM